MSTVKQGLSVTQFIFLILYYGILQYLPGNTAPVVGSLLRNLRYHCCKNIFKFCGKNVNVERRAYFGSGRELCIGDNSGLGKNCVLPSNITIGRDVMMGPKCYILAANHSIDRTDIPMIEQGFAEPLKTVIGDDVWIGRQVLFTPGRTVGTGSVIAAGCVLTKDFPTFSIVGGNPSMLLKSRIGKSQSLDRNN